MALLDECRTNDPASAAILETYLERAFLGRGRGSAFGHDDDGDDDAARMSPAEAYDVLGLAPGAPPDLIKEAHRRLMQSAHPDRGGSTYLAAKINEAKDVLLRRHR